MKQIREIRNSKAGKTLFANFAYLSLLQIANYVFPLLTLPYVVRIVGVENYGYISFSLAVVMWFTTIVDFGFNYTATRDVARSKDDLDEVSKIFSNVFWVRIILLLICVIPFSVLVYAIPMLYNMRIVLFTTVLLLPGYIMFPTWLFQGLEKMKYITILNILAKSVFTFSIFIFLQKSEQYYFQPLFNSIGYMIAGIVSFIIIIWKWRIKLLKPNIVGIKQTVSGSFDIFINQLFPNLYNSFSVLFLGTVHGTISNGIYDAGVKLANIVLQLFNLISRTFFPFLSRKIEYHSLYAKWLMFLILILSILLFVFSPILIDLIFSNKFKDANVVSKIMSISIFFLVLSEVYGTNYLILIGKEKLLRNITLISSIIGFILSIPLVYYLDYVGVAITVFVVRFLLGIFSFYYSRKIYKYEVSNS
ncbi:oligosaccharide flippase family protein [Parabacteroides sp. BX2]|uniref:Oligosaccharide flippase family protein n=1 Tax=Parabacteroides segnis TaxID=2763058 RepID=A0ABR7E3F1_9BACT|nr:oligosaccharide flippase family protein [Parabacteroides segnis]MBC5643684.1 oligosaccharide flippase family protein [Parabacteroides segnis]